MENVDTNEKGEHWGAGRRHSFTSIHYNGRY